MTDIIIRETKNFPQSCPLTLDKDPNTKLVYFIMVEALTIDIVIASRRSQKNEIVIDWLRDNVGLAGRDWFWYSTFHMTTYETYIGLEPSQALAFKLLFEGEL